MGLLKFFWGMNPAQNEFTFFGNFVTFFGVLFIRMKFSTFFWIFSLNCVSRIPSVRIALKKGRVQGKFTKKKGGRKKICIAQAVSAFFNAKNPLTTT